ncbi:MAG: hypothetical protein WCL53_04705 [Chloroflexota bacterium]
MQWRSSPTPTRSRPQRSPKLVTSTAFWAHIGEAFPNLSRDLSARVERRKANGLIKNDREYCWLVGTQGVSVEPDGNPSTLIGFRVAYYPHLPLGRFQLHMLEWDVEDG